MIEKIQEELKSLLSAYSDTRFHLVEIEPALQGGTLVLKGRVLDSDILSAVAGGLSAAFPALKVDSAGVQVLRAAANPRLAVATNLTGLHAGPSWLSEQLSQMVFGAQVEVLFEEGSWVYVRQADGYLGWTYRLYLGTPPETPTHLVCAPVLPLFSAPEPDAPLVSRLLFATGVRVLQVRGEWAEVQAHVRGWARLDGLRALAGLPLRSETARRQILADAYRMIGVQYLWGGCTGHGIDCSGLAQAVHRLSGYILPRDADLQMDAGRPVEPPYRPGDLVFFGESGERRVITHVAISLGGWQIIHSSRSRNGVYVDDIQTVAHLKESWQGGCTFIED